MDYYMLVLVKFLIGFLIVMTHFNLSGKTQLSQMTPIDFIGNFVIGGIIGGVIYSDAIPLHQYIIVLIMGVILISLLNSVSKRIQFFRKITIGKPITIIKDHRFLMENIRNKRNKVDIFSLLSHIHAQGIHSLLAIKHAQIEPGGQITLARDEDKVPSCIVMKEGEVQEEALEQIGKTPEWLLHKMVTCQLAVEDVYLAEYWEGNISFILMDGKVVNNI
ncbi:MULTISPECIES: DUF421 domain-containing protein [Serratia]|uniref:DUF421 domain-containing protein n=1 Tax=Serratia TaxID=613 RepID=UPI000B8E67A4|nr:MULTISPECIES: YetF domain-containing protein [unclassified Serratia (in: enterobacteria)]